MPREYSKYRNLTRDQAEVLHAEAMRGTPSAVRGYIAYTLWCKIKATAKAPVRQLALLHNALMKNTSIKIEKVPHG